MTPTGVWQSGRMGFLLTRWSVCFWLSDQSIAQQEWVPVPSDEVHHPIIWISCMGLSVYHLHLSHSLLLASLSQLFLDPTRNTYRYHHLNCSLFPLQNLHFAVNDNHFQLDKVRYGILKTSSIFSMSLRHSLLEESNVSGDFKSKAVNWVCCKQIKAYNSHSIKWDYSTGS